MNLNFDTATLTPTEAQAAILLLSTLFPSSNSQPVIPPTAQPSHMAVIGAGMARAEVEAVGLALISAGNPQPSPAESTPGRRRRTKAEMAADALLAKTGHAPAVEAEAQRVAEEGHPEEAEAILQEAGAAATAKPISADDLRSLLNSYIKKHGMDEAIAQLKRFGCNRVTEALALDPVKLNELAAALNG